MSRLAICAFVALLLSGCLEEQPLEVGGIGYETDGLAVVCSDYLSSSVTLLSPSGEEVLAPVLIHSGSRPPALSLALGGDVTLPSEPPPGGEVLLIDRYPNGTLTFVDPVSARVERQLKVPGDFLANPHDALVLDDGRILVTRYGFHPQRHDVPELERGDDLLLMAADGSPLAALPMERPDGRPGRPDSMLRVGDEIWVSISNIAADWSEYFDGTIVRVRAPDTADTLEALGEVHLGSLKNCSQMATDGARVAVACTGAWDGTLGSFVPGTSGVVLMDRSGAETARLTGDDARLGAAFAPSVAFEPGGTVVAVLFGDLAGTPDYAVRWDPAGGAVEYVYQAAAPWTIWNVERAVDGTVLLPDASRELPRLCRLGAEATCLQPCSVTGLPPRAVSAFRPPR